MAFSSDKIGKILRHRGERYTLKRIEDCVPGDRLDLGSFIAYEAPHNGQGSNTWNVRLADGTSYTETRKAVVRVWVD